MQLEPCTDGTYRPVAMSANGPDMPRGLTMSVRLDKLEIAWPSVANELKLVICACLDLPQDYVFSPVFSYFK